jgi:hypothetical protein
MFLRKTFDILGNKVDVMVKLLVNPLLTVSRNNPIFK